MPQLHYWRYEELPGADSFSHIDPSDHEGREQAWAEVKQNLAEETAEWVPKGRELVALFEHARRSGGVLRRQVFAVAYEGPIDFDTLCDRVLAGVDHIEPFSIAPSVPGRLDGCGLAWEVHDRWPGAALLISSGITKPAPDDLPPNARFLSKPLAPERLVKELTQALSAAL